MTTPFLKLNEFLSSPLTLRPGKSYRIPIKSMPSAGFVCSVCIEGSAVAAEFEDSSAPSAATVLDGSTRVVGGAVEQFLVVHAKDHGRASLVLRHGRPWQDNDPLAEELRVDVFVVDPAVQEAWEASVPLSEVSNDEVRRLLDHLDGRRPYGGKRVAHARSVLEILAKDFAAHRHAGIAYDLSDDKVGKIVEVLPRTVFPRSDKFNVRNAMEQFIKGR